MIMMKETALRRAEADAAHLVAIDLPPSDDAECARLLFEILGWQLVTANPGQPAPRLQLVAPPDGEASMILVATGDPALADVLARNGLDRLMRPLSLAALEQLVVFAG